jgi:hypothetical protein
MILHYHKIIWANICCCNLCKRRWTIHAQSCRGAWHTLDFLDFISNPKKMISSNRCGMVGGGLGKLRKGGNELRRKKNTFSRSNYNWVSCVFGDKNKSNLRHASGTLRYDFIVFLWYHSLDYDIIVNIIIS